VSKYQDVFVNIFFPISVIEGVFLIIYRVNFIFFIVNILRIFD